MGGPVPYTLSAVGIGPPPRAWLESTRVAHTVGRQPADAPWAISSSLGEPSISSAMGPVSVQGSGLLVILSKMTEPAHKGSVFTRAQLWGGTLLSLTLSGCHSTPWIWSGMTQPASRSSRSNAPCSLSDLHQGHLWSCLPFPLLPFATLNSSKSLPALVITCLLVIVILRDVRRYLTMVSFWFVFLWWLVLQSTCCANSHLWLWASLVAQLVKNLPAMQETLDRLLGREDSLEKR